MSEFTIGPPGEGDKDGWRRLYDGYAAFYEMPMADDTAQIVWEWIQDPEHVVGGLLAKTAAGEAVGLAHYRDMPSPLRGTTAGFLDDLYVDPDQRGSGVAAALINEVGRIGKERGWPFYRWLTAENNYRARGLYDRVAARTHWITYQYEVKDP